jgi:hypothetical protein
MGKMIYAYKMLLENLSGRSNLKDTSIDVRIILKCTLKKVGMGWICLTQNRSL